MVRTSGGLDREEGEEGEEGEEVGKGEDLLSIITSLSALILMYPIFCRRTSPSFNDDQRYLLQHQTKALFYKG